MSVVFCQITFCQTTWAAQLPKTAVAHLQLDQPAIRIQFPQVDLSSASITGTGLTTFSHPGQVFVGSASYQMDEKSFLVLKDAKKGLNLDNIKLMQYRLYSSVVQKVIATLTVDMEKGIVYFNKTEITGVVTEVWP